MRPVRILFALFAFLVAASTHALEVVPYTPTALAQAQQSGKSHALHFHADWCPVCRAQSKVIEKLKSDPMLDLTVFIVNYDTEKPLRKRFGVHTQSTLIAFKGKNETARLAGDTDADTIRAVLASAL
jgi:thioredoxin-like negative regulator of GroEL